jgi:hypothetical protein
MKTRPPLVSRISLSFAAIVMLTTIPHASAVPVTFSGGGGTPLSFSLSAPVEYTITADPAGNVPLFVFRNVGQLLSGFTITGNITYSVNSGLAQTLMAAATNTIAGTLTINDLIFYGDFVPLTVGDVVVLSAGTWTTTGNAPGVPVSGSYDTVLLDGSGVPFSTNGISLPENFSTLWLALPLVGMFAARRFTAPRR